MSDTPRLLAFAGSARKDSWNKRLLAVAAEAARSAGADVTLIDLADYELPLFNQDLEAEAGPPANAVRLKELFTAHDGLLIAAPEYNSSITPLLKNTIDWVSRPSEGYAMLSGFRGKTAGLLSASTGGLGGLRGLVHVRDILGNIGVLVLPEQVTLPRAADAFDDAGGLREESKAGAVANLAAALVWTTARLKERE